MVIMRLIFINFLLFLSVCSTYAGIITTQTFTKDGRTVVLCGDQHYRLSRETSEQWLVKVAAQKQAIFEGINLYKLFEGDKKHLSVLYECEGGTLRKMHSKNEIKPEQNFSLLDCFKDMSKDLLVSYIDIERRGWLFVYFYETIGLLNSWISAAERHEGEINCKREPVPLCLKGKTLKTLKEEYDGIFDYALKNSEGILYDIIEELHKKNERAYLTYTNFLRLLPPSLSLLEDDDLYEYFVKFFSFETTQIGQITNKYGTQLSDYFISLYAINDLATIWYIEKKAEDNILAFIGDDHRENVAVYLDCLGYKCEAVCQVESKTFKRTFDLYNQEGEIKNLLTPECIKQAIVDINKLEYQNNLKFEKKDDPKKSQTCLCDVCGTACSKKPSETLRCLQCKKIYYCSSVCRSNDWKFHKHVCGKPLYW